MRVMLGIARVRASGARSWLGTSRVPVPKSRRIARKPTGIGARRKTCLRVPSPP